MADNPGAIQKAKMYVWTRQFHLAIDALNNAIFEQESVREAKWLRANIYVLTGRFAAAKKDLKVLSRKRKWKPARGGSRADVDRRAKDGEAKPVEQLQASLAAAESAQNQGMTAHAMGQMTKCMNSLTEALKVAKASVFLHLLRAKAAYELRMYSWIRHDTAVVLQSTDVEHSAEQLEALQLLGEAQFDLLGQSAASLKNLRLCMRRDPGRTTGCDAAHARISAVLDIDEKVRFATKAEDWNAAIQFLIQQLELDGTSAAATEARAVLCGYYPKVQQGKFADRAVKDCTAAIKLLDDKADLFDQGECCDHHVNCVVYNVTM